MIFRHIPPRIVAGTAVPRGGSVARLLGQEPLELGPELVGRRDRGGLAEAVQDAKTEVERQVRDSEEVAAVVRALEEQYDAFARSVGRTSLLAESAPIPTADELGAEFERFLAQQSGD